MAEKKFVRCIWCKKFNSKEGCAISKRSVKSAFEYGCYGTSGKIEIAKGKV